MRYFFKLIKRAEKKSVTTSQEIDTVNNERNVFKTQNSLRRRLVFHLFDYDWTINNINSSCFSYSLLALF